MALVKNTFIDVPGSSTQVPTPLATAPAKFANSLKESLAAAAEEEESAEGSEPFSRPRQAVGVGRRARTRPGPLLECVDIVPQGFVGAPLPSPGASSIPPTPVATWEVTSTPEGTPAARMDQGRTTLSLVDMIQSPKGPVLNLHGPPTTLPPVFQGMQGNAQPPPPQYTPHVRAPGSSLLDGHGGYQSSASALEAPAPPMQAPAAAVQLGLMPSAAPGGMQQMAHGAQQMGGFVYGAPEQMSAPSMAPMAPAPCHPMQPMPGYAAPAPLQMQPGAFMTAPMQAQPQYRPMQPVQPGGAMLPMGALAAQVPMANAQSGASPMQAAALVPMANAPSGAAPAQGAPFAS